MSSVAATSQKLIEGEKSCREFSSSALFRSLFAGVATSVCSVLIFLLDSSVPQEQYSAGRELAVYAFVLCAALVCTRTACKAETVTLNLKRTSKSVSSAFDQLRSTISGVSVQVGQFMSELKSCLTPPQRRAGHDNPVVPAWAIVAVVGSIFVFGALLVLASFLAGSSSLHDPFTLFDASPRSCGPDGKPLKTKSISWSSMGWIAAAIWLSSGLCVTHPLTSGLVLGF